jgi:hypothetical protein
VNPDEFVLRVETFMQSLHSDGVPFTLAAGQKSIRHFGLYEAEFRIRLCDRTSR